MIIGISGKKNHGKDTVVKIINFLATGGLNTYESLEGFLEYYNDGLGMYPWETKRFADVPKDITCRILGCTREQLEDPIFKEAPLGEEWDCWIIPNGTKYPDIFSIDVNIEWIAKGRQYVKRRMTPRMFMQLLGTDCGRNIIHPNTWVNVLMKDYKQPKLGNLTINPNTWQEYEVMQTGSYPNWLIPDVRFYNEVNAIKDRKGYVYRVNNNRIISTDTHRSETELDNYEGFDAIFNNNGTILELAEQVKKELQSKQLIK